MKNILTYRTIYKPICVLMAMLFALSCENTNLDLQVSPNDPSPDAVDVENVYNSLQLSLGHIQFRLEDQAGEVTRMYPSFTGSTYEAQTPPTSFDGLWNNVYANFLPDFNFLEKLASERKLDIHRGTAHIMKAYVLMAMVDVFAKIPYSEAGKGFENLNPKVDEGSVVYDSADLLLDKGIKLLTDTKAERPLYDNFYNGKTDKWIALANTFKLRAALYKNDKTKFDAIIAEDKFIKDVEDDFQVNYGSSRVNPDSRHPRYERMYETDDGDYMSNYYMWLLAEDKKIPDPTDPTVLVPQEDPRIRYYFYRKISDSEKLPGTAYSCFLSDRPDQTKRPVSWGLIDPQLLYCYGSTKGYFGRDHLNNSGISPDAFARTAYGVYPAGGDFDANDFVDIRNKGINGGLGKGILPIMLASYVDFMRAEMASVAGDAASAKTFLLAGVEKSLKKVRSFESLVVTKMTSTRKISGVEKTVKEAYGMSEAAIDAYKLLVGSRYDNAAAGNPSASSKLDVIIKEYYIAAYGNGLEAYNMYRRTSFPYNIQPSIQKESGAFPLSFRYANAFVDRNGSVEQKDVSERVFWHTNTNPLR